jgi:hypothetical protein
MKNKHCSWCDNHFETKISYQIYCSVGCRELATREKIAERYAIIRRKKLQENPKKCNSCGGKLSAYNNEKLCQVCIIDPKEVYKTIKKIRGYSNGKPVED